MKNLITTIPQKKEMIESLIWLPFSTGMFAMVVEMLLENYSLFSVLFAFLSIPMFGFTLIVSLIIISSYVKFVFERRTKILIPIDYHKIPTKNELWRISYVEDDDTYYIVFKNRTDYTKYKLSEKSY